MISSISCTMFGLILPVRPARSAAGRRSRLLLLVAAHRTCRLLEPLLQMGKHPAAADGNYIWQDAAYLAGWSTGYRVRLSEMCNGVCSRCVRG